MSIRVIPGRIQIPGRPNYIFLTRDDQEFTDYEEARLHENSLIVKDKVPIVYEQIWTIQEAINKAAAEHRVVRFIWTGDNASIRRGIVDKKGCQLMKPDRDSNDIAVIPPNVQNFDFEEVM